MSENRDEATGQFAASEEPLFGLAAEEAEAGYKPMPTGEAAEPEEFANAREAADALAVQEQADPIPLVYHNQETGERLNDDLKQGPVETVKLERAADDLAAYEAGVVDHRASSISSEFAEMVDRMRAEAVKDNPDLVKELGIEAPKVETQDKADIAKPPAEEIPGLDPEVAKALQHPQVRQAIESELGEASKVREAYSAGLHNAHAFAQAAFLEAVPELAGLPVDQMERGLAMLAQVDPPRFNTAMNILGRVQHIQAAHQQDQQQRAQIARQQFAAYGKEQDAKFNAMVGKMTPAESAEFGSEMVEYAAELGVSREQLIHELQTNPVMRHAAFQKMAYDAIKYRQIQKAPKAMANRSVPPVQRPGAASPRVSAPDSEMASLRKQFAAAPSVEKQLRIAARIQAMQEAS